jgi:PAS domain S-box-containing protein/diguanylate cyclase (GGDEF)-like protein
MHENTQPSPRTRPRRIQFRMRTNGVLEATIPLADNQALAPYLANRRGSVSLQDVVWVDTGKRVDLLTVAEHEIVWARPLDRAVPLLNVTGSAAGAHQQVEVVLAGGQTLRGRLGLFPGQRLSEYLNSSGAFLVLWEARLPDDRALGDLAVNRSALRNVREVGELGGQAFWEQGVVEQTEPALEGMPAAPGTSSHLVPPAAGTSPGTAAPDPESAGSPTRAAESLHWLVTLARRANLPGAAAVVLPRSVPTADVWRSICAGGTEESALASIIAAQLKLPLAESIIETPGAAQLVSESLAARHGIRVLSDDGRTLTVATVDPMDADAEQAITFSCKRRIVFAVATPEWLGIEAGQTETEADLEALIASVPSHAGDVVRIEEDLDPRDVRADEVTAAPIIKLANLILREGVRQNASDIHLEPDGNRGLVRFRVDGVLRTYMHIPIGALHRVISRYKVVSRLNIADRIRPQDGRVRVRVDGRSYELRLSTVPTQDAEKAVIRIAGSVQEQTLEQLEIPDHELALLRQLLSFRDGIVIVTGPTGSGKTTTLYAALNEVNDGKVNIMTVEDPVERALAGITQIQVQSRRGVTFASALRAILRQDPDVILIGEIRDLETAEIAVQAAMTGHLVFTTLHTTSAVGVVERLRDIGLDRASLASSLRGVVAQRLARRTCSDCSGAGCARCERSGFRGRIPLLEVLSATPHFCELIGQGALHHDLQRAALAQGMRPIREVAAQRVSEGITTEEEILRVLGESSDPVASPGPDAAAGLLAVPRNPAEQTGPNLISDGEAAGSPALLPVRLADLETDAAGTDSSPGARRERAIRSLLQGLDRCVAEGRSMQDVLHFACEQLAGAFDSPLAWVATMEEGELAIRASAGACAPYVRDLVPDWGDLAGSDGAVATALRTGTPQARHIAQEPGFDGWTEHARLHGLPIFMAVPMEADDEPAGVVGVHARSLNGLDAQAGAALVNVVERIGGVVRRLRGLEAAGLQLAALELAADAVFTTDRRGLIQWVNRSFTALSGYAAAEVLGKSPAMLRSGRQDAAFYKELWDTILAGHPWRGELYNRRRDGTEYAVEQTITPVSNDQGLVTHFLSVQRDITERKQREESVQQLVTRDARTGLPNGRALDGELGRMLRTIADGGPDGALLLVRVDGCAELRESAGPDAAERLVSAAATVCSATLRPRDYLARIGDDEFAALLPATPHDGALIAANRLADAVATQRCDSDQLLRPLSVTIGVALVDGTQGARAVLAMADAALYGAPQRDGPVVLHTGAAEAEDASGDEEWARRIREALEDDYFILHFQPVVRLATGTISHYDALIRLHAENGEVIPARAFIAHAENLGLLPKIDRWVVENVLRMLHTSPDLRVSLNLSAATITDPAFRQFLQRQSRRMSAVGARIIFEVEAVTDTRDLPRMLENMNRLRDLGCRFALDNFCIDGVSLASLGTLPVDYVKLDGSLVRGVDSDEARREIVGALASIARALGKEVIAGWAERESIVALLPGLGIELAQGHYLGQPAAELRREENVIVRPVPRAVTEYVAGVAAEHDVQPYRNGNGNGRAGPPRPRLAV